MSVSRRSFFQTVGAGSAVLSAEFIIGRGREAMAFEGAELQPPNDGGFIRISSNENARGPGRKTMDALHGGITPRVGRGYPPDYVDELTATIASTFGVGKTSVIVGTGSGPILEAAARAFCAVDKPLVTAAPTYATCEQTARRMGVPVKVIQVDRSLSLDIEAMAKAATGAGLVFFCNPNNPTGTVHSAATVEGFVRRVKQASPDTKILLDEAYIDFVHDPTAKTAAPLTQELPGVFITRSFSKAHGMAGRRLGDAIGQPDTMQATRARGGWAASTPSRRGRRRRVAARREAHRRRTGRERPRPRLHAPGLQGSRLRRGGRAHQLHLHRPRAAGEGVPRRVRGAESARRISLGTMEEMRVAVGVFRSVLTASTRSRAQ